MSDVERILEELIARGLVARNETGAGVTFGVDASVTREITHWMQAHPEEKQGVSAELIAGELGYWYASSFEKLADNGGAEASEQAAGEARAALQCFLDAQSFGELGSFGSRLVNGTRDPELLGQVVDDFTAAGVTVVFGDYRIRRFLGAGAVSAVFEGERVDNALPVAVKVFRGAWPEEKSDVLRFLDDAKVANRVRHPNVVEIFDAGHSDGTRFVTMELLRGRSLERRWRSKDRRLPLKRVLEIGMHTLGVLAAAHEKSILHGGVRPSTIFITTDGAVKVLDFGFDNLTRSPHAPPLSSGGPAPASFVAPEQARGELLDPRTDLWSLGSTMLALLAGHAAEGDGATQLAPLLPDVPSDVVAVLQKALRPERADRWQTAKEMWKAIAAIHSALPDPAEEVGDLGPRAAPIVDTSPVGPLSERVVFEDEEPKQAEKAPAQRQISAEPAITKAATSSAAPIRVDLPVQAVHASPARDGVSKPFVIFAGITLAAVVVALTLRVMSRPDNLNPVPDVASGVVSAPPPPAAPDASGAPPIEPAVSASGDVTVPSPVTTGNTPLSSGDKRNGDQCGDAAECASAFCVDGVCCSSACTGTCVACNLRSFLGTCAEIPFGLDPDKECGARKTCDGDGSCGDIKGNGKRCKAGRECTSTFCVRGICCATECRGTDGNCSTGVCKRSLLIE